MEITTKMPTIIAIILLAIMIILFNYFMIFL